MIKKHEIGPLGTNCYLFIDDVTGDAAIIDPAYPSDEIMREQKSINLKYILITHAHIDHIFGAAELKRKTGAKVVAHLLEAERLKKSSENLYDIFHELYKAEGIYQQPYEPLDIDIAVDTGDVIVVGNSVLSVLHTPGHTNGSVCYLTDKEIFCGDVIFAGSYGRVDFKSGNFSEIVDSYKRLCNLDGDYILYPGHQRSTTLNDERNFNPLKSYLYF